MVEKVPGKKDCNKEFGEFCRLDSVGAYPDPYTGPANGLSQPGDHRGEHQQYPDNHARVGELAQQPVVAQQY